MRKRLLIFLMKLMLLNFLLNILKCFQKNSKEKQQQKTQKNMFLKYLHHFQRFFSKKFKLKNLFLTCLVFNVFISKSLINFSH